LLSTRKFIILKDFLVIIISKRPEDIQIPCLTGISKKKPLPGRVFYSSKFVSTRPKFGWMLDGVSSCVLDRKTNTTWQRSLFYFLFFVRERDLKKPHSKSVENKPVKPW